eukprot:jgi/Astpho2/4399/Aster-00018
MASVKDLPVLQDGPPAGGFPSIRFARRLPSTGPTGFTLFSVTTAIMAYGFYKVGETNHERRAEKLEKKLARYAIMPVLQAEEDRRWLEAHHKFVEQEAKIMEGVDGWEPGKSVYSSKNWMPPARDVGVWGGA